MKGPMNRHDADIAAAPPTGHAGWLGAGAVRSVRRTREGALLECDGAAVRISFERAGIVRVRIARDGEFAPDFSWAVISCEEPVPDVEFRETPDAILLATGGTRVRVDRSPCRVHFLSFEGEEIAGEDLHRGACWAGPDIAAWMTLHGDEHFFGLGEKGPPLDKRGVAIVNWNHDAHAHEPWSDPLYQTHPFVIVSRPTGCHGLFFDNTYRSWFDLGLTSRTAFGFGSDGGELNYYFIPGPTMGDVVRRYARLVGTAPLPPRWALGYQQCRWSYENEKRVTTLAALFRRRRIPCDTIYLDIDYMDGYRCFTWHSKRFPRPAAMTRRLARDGFKIVTIVDPGIKLDPKYSVYRSGLAGDHFATRADGKPYIGKVWPDDSAYPDFLRNETRAWWGEQIRALIDAGVRGIWTDMNEPSDFLYLVKTPPLDIRFDGDAGPCDHRAAHNVYGMEMARATREGALSLHPQERPFVLTRAGYAGVHRYSAVWTGDNASSWDHLRMSIPMQLNMGLSGIGFVGADVGGFRGTASAELFARWLQLGLFSPLFRTHTGGGPEQDPCAYGPRFEKINRRTIETRYRLLPYLYTELKHHSDTGDPVLRPLVLDFPDHVGVADMQTEFMFGRSIFAAPVVAEGEKIRRILLPPGDWYEFHPAGDRPAARHRGALRRDLIATVDTGRKVPLDAEIPVTLESIPMLVRPGTIIPLQPVQQFTDQTPLTELTLAVFPGAGRGEWYHDDGISFDYRRGAFVLEEYESRSDARTAQLRLARREGQESFSPRDYLLRFEAVERAPASVEVGGVRLRRAASVRQVERGRRPGWVFDARRKAVVVRTARWNADEEVTLRLATGRR